VVQAVCFVRAPFCFAYDFTEAGNRGQEAEGGECASEPTQTFPDSLFFDSSIPRPLILQAVALGVVLILAAWLRCTISCTCSLTPTSSSPC